MTIGQVRAIITDSPGIEGENVFHNYKPQKWEQEEYMCVETGIDSGTFYCTEHLFGDREAAYEEANLRSKV